MNSALLLSSAPPIAPLILSNASSIASSHIPVSPPATRNALVGSPYSNRLIHQGRIDFDIAHGYDLSCRRAIPGAVDPTRRHQEQQREAVLLIEVNNALGC